MTDAGSHEDQVADIDLHGFANGGAAIGRLPDGTACFVEYAIPGERVRIRVVERRRRWARGDVVTVLSASPDRVTPPCPLFGPGRCGGCKLQHIAPERQAELLADTIVDQLRRIGHLDVDGPVEMLRPHDGDGMGYRHRARFAVDDAGRLAFRRAASHDLQPVDDCPLLTPDARAVQHTIASGWRGVRQVALQVGTNGATALAVSPGRGRMVVPGDLPVTVTTGRGRQGARGRGRGSTATYAVAGRTYRVHATSFFQISVAAAEQLVALVRRMTAATPGTHVLELCAGVGLLTAALAADGARVTAVESNRQACADAEHNTADLDVRVVRATAGPAAAVDRPVDAVVLDPPRTGTTPQVIDWIARQHPQRVTYVSCDPATFARDAARLTAKGYRLAEVVGVDQFTHTGHVELVGAFQRGFRTR